MHIGDDVEMTTIAMPSTKDFVPDDANTTIYDYLLWRGDIDITKSPLNPCDYLIFSVLSYSDIAVLEQKSHQKIKDIASLAASYLLSTPKGEAIDLSLMRGFFIPNRCFFEALAASSRYDSFALLDYEDRVDIEKNIQFSAYTWVINDELMLVCYRGTDMSLAGWKEDFLLGIEVVPAQTMAHRYLCHACEQARARKCTLVVAGHSKGGNLAAYAAASLDENLRASIERVYNFDGPNFSHALDLPDPYTLFGARYVRIMPEFSVVGQLFDDEHAPKHFVKSIASGMMQHGPLSWCVVRDHFVEVPAAAPAATRFATNHKNWEGNLSNVAEKQMIDEVFDALYASGKQNFDEILQDPSCWKKIFDHATSMSKSTRAYLGEFVELIFNDIAHLAKDSYKSFTQDVGDVVKHFLESLSKSASSARAKRNEPESVAITRTPLSSPNQVEKPAGNDSNSAATTSYIELPSRPHSRLGE